MNMVDFQEKMDPNHRAYFCRMLKMKDLPEYLLEVYHRVKMLADRIDGFLSPGELALIAVMAGVDEQKKKEVAEKKETPGEVPAMTRAEAVASGAVESIGPLDVADDKEVEKILEPPVESVSGATGQAPPTARPDEGKAMLWSPGMPVNVLQADDLKQGKIVSVLWPKLHEVKPVQLTVEFEGGETVTVEENEVEAI